MIESPIVYPRLINNSIVEIQGKRYRAIFWSDCVYEFEGLESGCVLHGKEFSEERVSNGIKNGKIKIIN